MFEYIKCRICDSSYCDGCNTLILTKMLHARKFDCLLDEHHCINPCADIEVVKHGRWKKHRNEKTCSVCGFIYYSNNDDWNFCPNCGVKMKGE